MAYSTAQLIQLVVQLTERLNDISSEARTTDQLLEQTEIDFDLDSLIRISTVGVSKKIKTSTLLGGINVPFYDTVVKTSVATIADFADGISVNPLPYKFYLCEEIGASKVWFASKQTNTEDFEISRLYFSINGEKRDLGVPDLTQNGFDLWDFGSLSSFPLTLSDDDRTKFQAWFHTGEVADGEIPIDASKFRHVKGVTSGTINTGTAIEINDIAAGGIYLHPIISKMVFGSLKCIDNTPPLTTGIGTKWKPFGTFENAEN